MVWRDLSAEQLQQVRHPHPKKGVSGRQLLARFLGLNEQADAKQAIVLDMYVHTLRFGEVCAAHACMRLQAWRGSHAGDKLGKPAGMRCAHCGLMWEECRKDRLLEECRKDLSIRWLMPRHTCRQPLRQLLSGLKPFFCLVLQPVRTARPFLCPPHRVKGFRMTSSRACFPSSRRCTHAPHRSDYRYMSAKGSQVWGRG